MHLFYKEWSVQTQNTTYGRNSTEFNSGSSGESCISHTFLVSDEFQRETVKRKIYLSTFVAPVHIDVMRLTSL